jgi:hypothetical protein
MEKQICEICGSAMTDKGEGAFELECVCAKQQSPEFYVYENDSEAVWSDRTKNNFYVVRNGEMKYLLFNNEERDDYEVIRYTSDFLSNNITTDEDLDELLDTTRLESVNNPWFEIFHFEDSSWEYGEVFFKLDTAVAQAIKLGTEEGFMV